MKHLIETEVYVRSVEAASGKAYSRLGLTDSAILIAATSATIVTADYDLYAEAARLGREVINFTHYRERVSPR